MKFDVVTPELNGIESFREYNLSHSYGLNAYELKKNFESAKLIRIHGASKLSLLFCLQLSRTLTDSLTLEELKLSSSLVLVWQA